MAGKYLKETPSSPGVIRLAAKIYIQIGGSQRAAAFAYYVFFSLFPLVILTVTIASFFVDRDRAVHEVIGYFKNYAPLSPEMNRDLFDTITGVVEASRGVVVIAPLIFFWGAFRFFNVLVRAVNEAWGTRVKKWWSLPLKNFFLLGITGLTILLGLGVPVIARLAKDWLFSNYDFVSWAYDAAIIACPLLVLFLGLSLLYRLAPCRPTGFAEIWGAALAVAAMLCVLESLFAIYLKDFAKLNVVYGTFGGMMALLMWIYLSGCIIVLGACLSAAQTEVKTPWWKNLPFIGEGST